MLAVTASRYIAGGIGTVPPANLILAATAKPTAAQVPSQPRTAIMGTGTLRQSIIDTRAGQILAANTNSYRQKVNLLQAAGRVTLGQALELRQAESDPAALADVLGKLSVFKGGKLSIADLTALVQLAKSNYPNVYAAYKPPANDPAAAIKPNDSMDSSSPVKVSNVTKSTAAAPVPETFAPEPEPSPIKLPFFRWKVWEKKIKPNDQSQGGLITEQLEDKPLKKGTYLLSFGWPVNPAGERLEINGPIPFEVEGKQQSLDFAIIDEVKGRAYIQVTVRENLIPLLILGAAALGVAGWAFDKVTDTLEQVDYIIQDSWIILGAGIGLFLLWTAFKPGGGNVPMGGPGNV
jgi:hypothetical protein